MDKTYIERVDKIKNKYNSKDFNTLKLELESYKELIPEFFSKNGEASGIRAMYEKLNDKEYEPVKINCIDLNIAESVYEDYLNGMYTFVQDMNTALVTESDCATYEEKLETAKNKDSEFIESLFGGVLNPVIESDTRESTSNLEVLINFIPKIDNFYNKTIILNESVSNDNSLINSSVEMICESVSNYTHNLIKHIMNTYYDIVESFNDEQSETTTAEFRLFY